MPLSFSVASSQYPIFIPIRLFIILRWVAISGQLITLSGVYCLLGFDLPVGPVSTILGISMIVNVLMSRHTGSETRLALRQIPYYLIYDLGQLTAMLFLTGGLNNPFCILILAPTAIAAAILSGRTALALCALALLAIALLALSPYPLPWTNGGFFLPQPFLLGMASALIIAILFITFYVWTVAREASQLTKALGATQLALAKEQKISSLGALAAAAAHELGSPLSTICVAAKEILSNLNPESPLWEDAQLLVSQSDRCRDILMKFSCPSNHDHPLPCQTLPLSAIIDLAARPHHIPSIQLAIRKDTPNPEPHLSLTPDLIHGLGNILQNAFQFAKSQVQVTVRWDDQALEAIIQDDGPGYPSSLLSRLGDPYLSGRQDPPKGSHLGLGLFIAQTLLSQRQGEIHFSNSAGACCLVRWPRSTVSLENTLLIKHSS
jgi:two-component system sensor histidine kinase RegB